MGDECGEGFAERRGGTGTGAEGAGGVCVGVGWGGGAQLQDRCLWAEGQRSARAVRELWRRGNGRGGWGVACKDNRRGTDRGVRQECQTGVSDRGVRQE